MMHPRTYVVQTAWAHADHFYKSVIGALEFDGPAVVNATQHVSRNTASRTTWPSIRLDWLSTRERFHF